MNMALKNELKAKINENLLKHFSTTVEAASTQAIYRSVVMIVRELLREKRHDFNVEVAAKKEKRVYYLSMEFLLGRSFKNSIYNLGINEEMQAALKELGVSIEKVYENEPDAGLGNGGLGRLAACYMDALATEGHAGMGYSILYEYGIFRQQIVDGWQVEQPDDWLPGGDIWLVPVQDRTVDIRFGGKVEENVDQNYILIKHSEYQTVRAVPYDLYISGYDTAGVSVLRLWKAEAAGIDMALFNKGDYRGAMEQNSLSELISKVLYPNDNYTDGKILRLRQQYFMVAASVGDIVQRHIRVYGNLESFADKVAMQLNDTHQIGRAHV